MKKAYTKPSLQTEAFSVDDVITVSAVSPLHKSLMVVANEFEQMLDDVFDGNAQKTLSRVSDAFEEMAEQLADTAQKTLSDAENMFEDMLDGFSSNDDKTLSESSDLFEDMTNFD